MFGFRGLIQLFHSPQYSSAHTSIVHNLSFQVKSDDRLFGPGLTSFLYACLYFTGSLAFVVGGDTVISSCTWKKTEDIYYFYLCRIFTGKICFFRNKTRLFFLHFFPHLSEKPAQLMSDAFSFCNFVYWFSIHINIPCI